MNPSPERRLYRVEQLPGLLELNPDQIERLVATGQLRTIRICGEIRCDSLEINQLIETYSQIAKRNNEYVQ
jgi:hypothetical protein